ncbi:MAG: hypothetical protein AAFZ18_22285 [Myxococcota bacterium]
MTAQKTRMPRPLTLRDRRGGRAARRLAALSLRGLLLSVALPMSGCTSQLPRRAAHRPLTLPAGENRVEFGLGPTLRTEAASDGSGVGFFGTIYARGITDRLELRLPLIARYRFGGDEAQWGIEGGIGGVGNANVSRRLEDDADPRQPPRFRSSDILVFPFLALMGRLPLSETLTLSGGLGGGFETDFLFLRTGNVFLSSGLVWSPIDELSWGGSLAGSLGLPGEVDARASQAQLSTSLRWHALPTFDAVLIISGGLYDELEPEFLIGPVQEYGIFLGFDWHFQ